MAQAVVIGGGFGGLACAVRLAKLGHQVTLLESSPSLGGALSTVSDGDFTWSVGPTVTLLPAVLRDLFRKSGRPLEREVDLVPLDLGTEHRFPDGSRLALPTGSTAAAAHAVNQLSPGLGSALGHAWTDYVGSFAGTWELVRRDYLERPWRQDLADPAAARLLGSRRSLAGRIRRELPDPRLRLVASYPFAADGHDLRKVPAWLGIMSYVEQRFGVWTTTDHLASVTDALIGRLATRGVTVLTETAARDLVVRGGRVAAVAVDGGQLGVSQVDADLVVCAIDPRRLPALATHVARTTPVTPARQCYLGLEGDVPALPHEVALHGDPLLIIRTGSASTSDPGRAAQTAWTVSARHSGDLDMLEVLARRSLDVRDHLVTRLDRTPARLLDQWGGSPLGVVWRGRSTVRRRLGPGTPIPGVYAAGAHATPGSGIPFVGLSAALVAQVVGPA